MKRRDQHSAVLKALKDRLPRDAKLLLAISGGVDSLVLGRGCYELKVGLGLSLEIAHFDHRLRPDSSKDSEFVKGWSERLGLTFHLGSPASPPPVVNIESWARNERYSFLSRIREQVGADWVLTAHHRDDLLETTLIQLLQNREPRGIVACDQRRRVLRPLLGVARSDILAFATGFGEVWREDPSNTDPRFLRNKVRAELVPFIREKFGDSAVNSLTERSIQIGDDIEYLRGMALASANDVCGVEWGSREWFRRFQETFERTHRLNRWRVVEESLLPVLGYRVGRLHALRFIKFIGGSRKVCELPRGISLVREGGGLRIIRLRTN